MIARSSVVTDLLAWLHSDAGQMALAGAAGGLVRWLTLREKWSDGLASLVVGGLCAQYLGPLVPAMLSPVFGHLDGGQAHLGFASFVVGLGGVGIAGFVIETLRRFKADKIAPASAGGTAPVQAEVSQEDG